MSSLYQKCYTLGMNSVADLVSLEAIQILTTPANFHRGQDIASNNGVSLTEFSPLRVTAYITGPSTQPRNTLLEATPAGLHWRCSCTSNKGYLCKHVVATALEVNRRAIAHHS